MNKSIWKEHASIHKQISEFTHSRKEKPSTPWHKLEKSQRREIIKHRHSCKNYTKIFLGVFVGSVAIASVIALKKEAKPATSMQTKVDFNIATADPAISSATTSDAMEFGSPHPRIDRC